jgi:hypothetical protein
MDSSIDPARNYGKGHPELGESSNSLIYIDEFKHSLPEEHAANHQAEHEHRSRSINRRFCKPLHYTFHGNVSFSFEMFIEAIVPPTFENCAELFGI